jgi:hypothetical protein
MPMVTSWTGRDARLFQQAAGLTNERFAERLNVSARAVAYWRKQADAMLPALAQRVLGDALDAAPLPIRERFDQLLADRQVASETVDGAVAAAASEADAEQVRLRCEIDRGLLDWLWDQVREIGGAGNRPAFETFTAARLVRRQALELAARTRRLGALPDLYVLTGLATGLMASAAFDMNRWDASASLIRSAGGYASAAGHSSLDAWSHGFAALLANWRNEPDTALAHLQHGLQAAPAGTPTVRLCFIAARSHALLGDAASVAAVLSKAAREQDHADQQPDPLSEQIGGEFAFGRARAAACAAAAWSISSKPLQAGWAAGPLSLRHGAGRVPVARCTSTAHSHQRGPG